MENDNGSKIKRKLLISLPYGMSARNILRYGVYEELKKSFQITLLTPFFNDGNFIREFSADGVKILNLPKRFNVFFKGYRYLLDVAEGVHYTRKHNIATLRILSEVLRFEKPITFWLRWICGSLLSFNPKIFKILRKLQFFIMRDEYYGALLDREKPDIIWQTHLLALEEYPLAYQAKLRGIPIIGMIHSWDNITSKSGIRTVVSNRPGRMLPIHYDHLIVWNEILKNELIRYYNYGEEEISVVGVPQFDFYKTSNFCDRKKLFQRLGGDPSKKLIFYACGSPFLLPKQDEILENLVQAVENGEFEQPVQLLIRGHPGTDMAYLKNIIQGKNDILLQFPSPAYAASRFQSGWKGDSEDRNDLADLIFHCSVLINVTSTMSLDAVILDRPTICIGFDGKQNRPYHFSIAKHYDFTHYRPVMESGGVRLATSFGELKRQIKAYLDDPHLDSDKRHCLAQKVNPFPDGCSSLRIAKVFRERV